MPRIHLFDDLAAGPIPSGSNLLVEFDPASQWYNAAVTIASKWLTGGGNVMYNVSAQRPENLRLRLNEFGLDARTLEEQGKLEIFDYYTASLGQRSNEKRAYNSLKVADLSIKWAKRTLHGPPAPDRLRIHDNVSSLARFNDDKAWVEFLLTRVIASSPVTKSTRIIGVATGIHNDWVYKTLETAVDAIIDFRLKDAAWSTIDVVRIRTARNVGFSRDWHRLQLGKGLEVSVDQSSLHEGTMTVVPYERTALDAN